MVRKDGRMKLLEKMKKFFSDCYGVDELEKFIWIVLMIAGIIAALTGMPGLMVIVIIGTAYSMCRAFSKDYWNRNHENVIFMRYARLLGLNFENRKYARVFLCKKCGRYIRVPKKKGKIEVTCPKCGNKEIHRT